MQILQENWRVTSIKPAPVSRCLFISGTRHLAISEITLDASGTYFFLRELNSGQLSNAACAAYSKSLFAMRVTVKSKLIALVVCWMSLEPSTRLIDEIDVGFINTKKDISSGLLKWLYFCH